LQRFATTLQNNLSPKTVINILETIFAVLRYAKKCPPKMWDYTLFGMAWQRSWHRVNP